MQWEPVIGLEVHTQLKTQSKLFSGSSTTFGKSPNSEASAVDLALPGTLPVLNKAVVAMAVQFGLAINATIAKKSIFARKNYFYPDLPKGYQISQLEFPIVEKGYLDINTEQTSKRINIIRAHIEEDAGKSLHEDFHDLTGIDLNRAGTPLLEIVSAPDLRSAQEAVAYMKLLHTLVCHLGICDGNMQEGSFRCDANVSVRRKGEIKLGTRTELKNINSFKFVEKAINYEIKRQIDILEDGGVITQETRLYDSVNDQTRPMRSKEEANDYRYFPDPDLLPIIISEQQIQAIQDAMPELPAAKRKRFLEQYALSEYDSDALLTDLTLANYFEAIIKLTPASPKLVANWLLGEISAALNKHQLTIAKLPISIEQVAMLMTRIADNTLSNKTAKQVFEKAWVNGNTSSIDKIIESEGLQQLDDHTVIENIIDQIIASNPEQVQQFKAGKEKVFGYFVGQIMKATQGKANPALLNKILLQKLAR